MQSGFPLGRFLHSPKRPYVWSIKVIHPAPSVSNRDLQRLRQRAPDEKSLRALDDGLGITAVFQRHESCGPSLRMGNRLDHKLALLIGSPSKWPGPREIPARPEPDRCRE